jgi:hypothetical protein
VLGFNVVPSDTYLTVRQAYDRYRSMVVRGELPELGERFATFRGRAPDWAQVVVLCFPDSSDPSPGGDFQDIEQHSSSAPAARPLVSFVVFRHSEQPPDDPSGYFLTLLQDRYPGARTGSVFLTMTDLHLSEQSALERYQAAIDAGDLPALGGKHEVYRGPDQDGESVTVLFFKTPEPTARGQ